MSEKKNVQLCGDCNWWNHLKDEANILQIGHCDCDKLAVDQGGVDSHRVASFFVERISPHFFRTAKEFWTVENFGCVHFDEKEP